MTESHKIEDENEASQLRRPKTDADHELGAIHHHQAATKTREAKSVPKSKTKRSSSTDGASLKVCLLLVKQEPRWHVLKSRHNVKQKSVCRGQPARACKSHASGDNTTKPVKESTDVQTTTFQKEGLATDVSDKENAMCTTNTPVDAKPTTLKGISAEFDRKKRKEVEVSFQCLTTHIGTSGWSDSSAFLPTFCPQYISEYAQDIFDNHLQLESTLKIKRNYLDQQKEMTKEQRADVMDWLVEVAEEYQLQTTTLYIAVNVFDRFLSQVRLRRCPPRLLGCTCMFIASKFHETFPPEVDAFVEITSDQFSREQIIDLEGKVLEYIKYQVTVVTPICFLDRLTLVTEASDQEKHMAQFLSELTLPEYEMLQFKGSIVAAAALVLSRLTMGDTQPLKDSIHLYCG